MPPFAAHPTLLNPPGALEGGSWHFGNHSFERTNAQRADVSTADHIVG